MGFTLPPHRLGNALQLIEDSNKKVLRRLSVNLGPPQSISGTGYLSAAVFGNPAAIFDYVGPGTVSGPSHAHSTTRASFLASIAIFGAGLLGLAALRRRSPQSRDTCVSLDVMNSSSAGCPAFVAAMPRRMAGTISSGRSTRSP